VNARSRRYAADFHIHTAHSYDSLTPVNGVIAMARRRKLDAIAITDHETAAGARAALRANRHDDLLIIPGVEIKTDLGDLIGLYVTADIKSRTFSDVLAEIHAQGGVTYLPHPIRTFGASRVPEIFSSYDDIDLWELYNGRYDDREYQQARSAFSELGIVGPLSGSDAHAFWEIGLSRALLDDLPRTGEQLLALHARAGIRARVRPEFNRRAGLALGTMTKRFKRREFRTLVPLVLSLPWRALRRGAKLVAAHARSARQS
jgi:predicted metal-dependent phosphoesterase TrpH